MGGEGQVDHGPCKLEITTHNNLHPATPTQVIVNHILQHAVVQFSATSEPVVLLYSSSHFCCALIYSTVCMHYYSEITTQLKIVRNF